MACRARRLLRGIVGLALTSVLWLAPSAEQGEPAETPPSLLESTQSLRGPFLGQTPPGRSARLFAENIVSTPDNEHLIGLFRDNTILLFERSSPASKTDWTRLPIWKAVSRDGTWTLPREHPTNGQPWYAAYTEAMDGVVVFFAWKRHLDGSGPPDDVDIWRVFRDRGAWREPERMGSAVNSDRIDSWPSVSQTGTLHFFSTRPGGYGRADLYRARSVNGTYSATENLGATVNTPHADHDPFVDPAERYLLLCSDRPGGYGGDDLYVAHRMSDGYWMEPVNLGAAVNSAGDDTRPYVTPGAAYLFFCSNRAGNRDIYWVDAGALLSRPRF